MIGLRRRTFLIAAALASAFRRLRGQTPVPSAPPFPSEAFHDEIAPVLARWSAGLRATPLDTGPLQRSLSQRFRLAASSASKPVRIGPSLEVRRVTYASATEWIASLKDFSAIQTAEFQITAIEGSRTRIRYEIVGSGPGFHREQRIGYWNVEWASQSIRSFTAEPETRSRAAHPWYADITEHALGPAPHFKGVDYWRTVLDGASGIDIYGHKGVAVGDIDNSGFDSIYICQPAGLPNRLYRNRGDGTFEDISATAGVDLLDNTSCALIADFNNNGHQDLLVVRATGPLLFLNQGNGKFIPKPDAFRFAHPPQGTFMGAAAADYNRDGYLDIYFCLYTFYQGAGQYNYPTPYFDAENGPPNFLMRNNGDATFSDATAEAGLNANNTRFSFCCAWGDLDNNGWPDLYVVNDFGRKNLCRNNGDGTFTDIAKQAGVEDPGAGMGACWFDYDNDGREDLYVANMWTAAGERISAQPGFQPEAPADVKALYRKHAMGNSLFDNSGAGFENKTTFEGGGMGRWSWSCDAWDFDHDGFPDLYVANGMISGPQRADLNSFFWREVVANSPNTAIPSPEYEKGWAAINEQIRADHTWSGFERNVFYSNNRDGTFTNVSGAVGLDFMEDSRAFALADFDHDGRVEILLKNRNAPELRLMKNVLPGLPPSLAINLKGTKSNRDAIGASVTVGHQTRRIQAGSGFLSQHSKLLMFGLGDTQGPFTAIIRWPSGAVQTIAGLPANHRVFIEEGNNNPRIEAFLKAAPLPAAKPRTPEPLPTAFETWLLEPVPMNAKPGLLTITPENKPLYNILFRNLFDRHRDIPPGTSFLVNNAGEIVKVYQRPVTAQEAEQDLMQTPRALPYSGNSATYIYGRNHLSLGSAFFESGYLEQPELFFRLAQRDDPASAEPQYGLGSVYLKQDRRNEARAAFEQAVKLNAGYRDTAPNAWNNLGLLATREGRMDEAVRCFNEALKLGPDYWISLENLGNAYRQMGRPDDARKVLERALALHPRDAAVTYSLAMTFAQSNDSARAEDYLHKALALRPDYPEALNNLGILYLRTHRREDAVRSFEQSIRIAPEFDQAWLNLARVYALEGSKDKARALLESLLKQIPNHPQARQMLDQLR
jgi:Flp pilus assembly protein TadD